MDKVKKKNSDFLKWLQMPNFSRGKVSSIAPYKNIIRKESRTVL